MNNSFPISDSSRHRIGVSENQIVELKQTSSGEYHGYVRTWQDICKDLKLKNKLIKNGLVNKRGVPL